MSDLGFVYFMKVWAIHDPMILDGMKYLIGSLNRKQPY